jgi:hypothetical protein
MGFLRKVGKKIARGFRKVGRALKKGLGKIGKAFGKLGPLGSLALSFILPGVGTWLTTGPLASVVKPIIDGISAAGNFIKGGVKTVFNKVTDAIEYGINAVSDGSGTQFKNWVSETTKGFVDPSTKELPSDLSKKVDKFEASKDYTEDLVKVDTSEGVEYYQTDADGAIKQDPYKVITDTTTEEALETAKDTVAGVKDRYKKIQAVSSASNVFTEQEEAEQFNQAYQSKQFADIALENLGIQNARRYGAGVSDMMFIDLDRAGNSSNPSLSIYDDILKGIPISNNMTPEQIFSTINTYPQIQT